MSIFKTISRKFFHFKDALQFREAIDKAEKAHIKYGPRYYVLPSADGKLVVVDRKNYRILRRKHYIPQNNKMQDALDGCFYHTAHRNGNGLIPENVRRIKEEQYFMFKESYRFSKKLMKKSKSKKK